MGANHPSREIHSFPSFALEMLTVLSVCFPDCDQEKWTYDQTMERVLFKAPYRVCSILPLLNCLLSQRYSCHPYLSATLDICCKVDRPGLVHIDLTYKIAQQWTVGRTVTRSLLRECCQIPMKEVIIGGLLPVWLPLVE